jgi:hypothetical protein
MILFSVRMKAQDFQPVKGDSMEIVPDFTPLPGSQPSDSVQIVINEEQIVPKRKAFKPDPDRAILYSAIFPGLGQIYNRKYWKLPIVYGGFLGCIYAITWNGNQYTGYKNAYNDFTDKSEATRSWESYVPYSWGNPDEWDSQRKDYFTRSLQNKKDFYRRNRDLSYIITVGVYAICLLDAYVDAQLFDFDISPDLSFRIEPAIIPQATTGRRSFGLQCSLTF